MLKIVGFGSGAKDNMTLEASDAIAGADPDSWIYYIC